MEPQAPIQASGRTAAALLTLGRASEWWEYKFIPAIAVGYATALHLGGNPWASLGGLIWLLAALLPGGIFVSVLNDLTDRDDDASAGKANRQVGLRRIIPLGVIAACLAVGAANAWQWRSEPWIVAIYAVAWLAFTAYSVPPLRLKRRGLAGVMCDATGANLVPALLAALFSASALGRQPEIGWLAPVAIWSAMFGLRGILSHQIGDVVADRRSKTPTFVARSGPEAAAKLVRWIVFPIEVVALGALLIQTGSTAVPASLAALGLYLILIHERIDRFEMQVTLATPGPRTCLMLHEFYDVFLPLGLLTAGALGEPKVLIVAALHLALFPMRWRQVLSDFVKLLDRQYQRRPRRWRRN